MQSVDTPLEMLSVLSDSREDFSNLFINLLFFVEFYCGVEWLCIYVLPKTDQEI